MSLTGWWEFLVGEVLVRFSCRTPRLGKVFTKWKLQCDSETFNIEQLVKGRSFIIRDCWQNRLCLWKKEETTLIAADSDLFLWPPWKLKWWEKGRKVSGEESGSIWGQELRDLRETYRHSGGDGEKTQPNTVGFKRLMNAHPFKLETLICSTFQPCICASCG